MKFLDWKQNFTDFFSTKSVEKKKKMLIFAKEYAQEKLGLLCYVTIK